MGGAKITGLGTPTTGTDATTKTYVDGILGSATDAATSAAAALASEEAAAATYDAFDDRYLGSKASDPSVDNDGNALLTGAIYWNTTSDILKIYTGAAWSTAAFDTSGALIASNNLSELTDADAAISNLGITATATELNYVDGVTSPIQTQLGTKAPTASPTFTGVPAAPTATTGTNTTQIATTAFVQTEVAGAVTTPTHTTTTGAAQTVDFSNEYQTIDTASPVTTLTFSSSSAIQDVNVLVDLGGVGFDLSVASYSSVSFSVTSQEATPSSVAFNTDGTKMYVVGITNKTVYQYTLTIGFDLSTASYDSVSLAVSGQDSAPVSIAFNTDGTKMYILGQSNGSIFQYTLSTGFDVSTASYDSVSLSVSSQDLTPQGLAFNTDGTKMFMVGSVTDTVYQYTLTTGFDLSTASYDSVSLSVSGQDTSPRDIAFNTDGTKMFMVGTFTADVFEYTLTTGFDLSTASYASVSFSTNTQDANPLGIAFSSTGNKMFLMGYSNATVYQYSTTTLDSLVLPTSAISNINPQEGLNSYKFATVDSGTSYFLVSKAEGLGS